MGRYLLTDAELRRMQAGEHHDGGGLYCVVRSNSSASWHLRYTVKDRPDRGRPKLGLGSYPEISLAAARRLADDAHSLAAQGIDPLEEKQAIKRRQMTIEQAFEGLYAEKQKSLKDGGKAGRWMSPVRLYIIPTIGAVGASDLTVDMIVQQLGKVYLEKRDTGDKVFTRLKMALDFAAADDSRVDPQIVDRAKLRLPRSKKAKKRQDEGHHPALRWEDTPKLWMALPSDLVGTALGFYLLTLPRVANVRLMEWKDVDMKAAVWHIPPENIKGGIAFDTPLSAPALDLLRRAKRFKMDGHDLVFPNPKARKDPPILHTNALNNFLKDNNWPSSTPNRHAVAHGLRATFTAYVVTQNICDPRMAEMSIQHEVRSKVEKAYNRDSLLQQRREILEAWAKFVISGAKKQADQQRRMNAIPDPVAGQTVQEIETSLRGEKADWFDDQ